MGLPYLSSNTTHYFNLTPKITAASTGFIKKTTKQMCPIVSDKKIK